MKRVGYIYEKLIDENNIRAAIIDAAKKKRKRKGVQKILNNLDYYVQDLIGRFERLDFTSPYHPKIIRDGLSGKEREIAVPRFYPDQCAHHAIVRVLKPIVLKSSYYWSCSNIPGRGIKHAAIGIERATKRHKRKAKYCIKMDIKKFYPSCKHEMILDAVKRKIKDKKFIAVIKSLLDSYDLGLPIGNYTSPWLAEMVLEPVDNAIRNEGFIYVRFADDIVIIGNNKRNLRRIMFLVMEIIKSLGLRIKENWQLFRIYNHKKGRKIDFVGRMFARGFTMIRKRVALKLMRQSRNIQKSNVVSYHTASGFISRCAIFKWVDAEAMKEKYMKPAKITYLKGVIRNEDKRRLAA